MHGGRVVRGHRAGVYGGNGECVCAALGAMYACTGEAQGPVLRDLLDLKR